MTTPKSKFAVKKIRWRKRIFVDLYALATDLEAKLQKIEIPFSKSGYPYIPPEMLLNSIPDDIEMIPLSKRHQIKSPEKTILCAYENDCELYRFLRHFERNINECQAFYGVCGFDLSPRVGTDVSHQKFHLLLNALINVYMAVRGIRILPNWRTGNLHTLDILNTYPANTIFSVGSLGCAKGHTKDNIILLKTKLLYSRPKQLIYYGVLKKAYRHILDLYGVPYRVFMDYRSFSHLQSKKRKEKSHV